MKRRKMEKTENRKKDKRKMKERKNKGKEKRRTVAVVAHPHHRVLAWVCRPCRVPHTRMCHTLHVGCIACCSML